MKTKLLISLIGVLMCGCETGFSPIDDVLVPRKNCDAVFEFYNNSSAAVEISGTMSESSSSNDCSPYSADDKRTLAPGQSYPMLLRIVCRMCGRNTTVSAGSASVRYEIDPVRTRFFCEDSTGCRSEVF